MTHQSAVSIVVSRLERDGLVRRARSKEEPPAAIVSLTAAGGRLLRSAPKPPTSRLLAALRAMPASHLQSLSKGMRSLSRELGTDGDESMMLFEPRIRRQRRAEHGHGWDQRIYSPPRRRG